MRAADHGVEHFAAEQASRGALGVGQGDALDQAVASCDVVDAEPVELDLHELRGDLGRGVEAQRIGTDQVGLGLGKLLQGRSVIGKPLKLVLDDGKRIGGAIGARRRRARDQRGVGKRRNAGPDAVRKPALLAHLAIEPR